MAPPLAPVRRKDKPATIPALRTPQQLPVRRFDLDRNAWETVDALTNQDDAGVMASYYPGEAMPDARRLGKPSFAPSLPTQQMATPIAPVVRKKKSLNEADWWNRYYNGGIARPLEIPLYSERGNLFESPIGGSRTPPVADNSAVSPPELRIGVQGSSPTMRSPATSPVVRPQMQAGSPLAVAMYRARLGQAKAEMEQAQQRLRDAEPGYRAQDIQRAYGSPSAVHPPVAPVGMRPEEIDAKGRLLATTGNQNPTPRAVVIDGQQYLVNGRPAYGSGGGMRLGDEVVGVGRQTFGFGAGGGMGSGLMRGRLPASMENPLSVPIEPVEYASTAGPMIGGQRVTQAEFARRWAERQNPQGAQQQAQAVAMRPPVPDDRPAAAYEGFRQGMFSQPYSPGQQRHSGGGRNVVTRTPDGGVVIENIPIVGGGGAMTPSQLKAAVQAAGKAAEAMTPSQLKAAVQAAGKAAEAIPPPHVTAPVPELNPSVDPSSPWGAQAAAAQQQARAAARTAPTAPVAPNSVNYQQGHWFPGQQTQGPATAVVNSTAGGSVAPVAATPAAPVPATGMSTRAKVLAGAGVVGGLGAAYSMANNGDQVVVPTLPAAPAGQQSAYYNPMYSSKTIKPTGGAMAGGLTVSPQQAAHRTASEAAWRRTHGGKSPTYNTDLMQNNLARYYQQNPQAYSEDMIRMEAASNAGRSGNQYADAAMIEDQTARAALMARSLSESLAAERANPQPNADRIAQLESQIAEIGQQRAYIAPVMTAEQRMQGMLPQQRMVPPQVVGVPVAPVPATPAPASTTPSPVGSTAIGDRPVAPPKTGNIVTDANAEAEARRKQAAYDASVVAAKRGEIPFRPQDREVLDNQNVTLDQAAEYLSQQWGVEPSVASAAVQKYRSRPFAGPVPNFIPGGSAARSPVARGNM